jgi:signal transduction histidine kinase
MVKSASNLARTAPSPRCETCLRKAPFQNMNARSNLDADVAEHLRTQFLRRVAHDIASPAGVTLTVLDELAVGGTPRPELVAMARRSLRRLMRLSEHLALLAELETGGLEPEVATVDLRALTKQGVDEALAIDGRKDVVAAFAMPSAPAFVEADGRLLQFIVREIVGNALKLASSRVEVSLVSNDENVTVRVEDDGPGFSADSEATLGRRFIARTSSRGLGLSLSMAIELLGLHGGSLALSKSTLPPGRRGAVGAAVAVTLPAARAGITPSDDETSSSGGSASRHPRTRQA